MSRRDGDWYSCIRSNILGRPSIVFKRLVDATGNPLLPNDHPERHLGTRDTKCVQKVVGKDAVSLYPLAMMEPIPTGAYVH